MLGLLAVGPAISDPVAGDEHTNPDDGGGVDEAPTAWTRLYQGTAAVTVSYFTELDREAAGEFAVDVRFRESESLATGGPPFALRLRTGELLSGNFVTHESSNPYLPSPPLIEGSVWIETERGGGLDSTPVRPWAVAYDVQTGGVDGSLVEPSEYFEVVNSVTALGPSVVGYLPEYKQANAQSTFEGTIGEESLALRFDIVDVDLTISATVEVSAERRA